MKQVHVHETSRMCIFYHSKKFQVLHNIPHYLEAVLYALHWCFNVKTTRITYKHTFKVSTENFL